jgi:hypothetical protein
MEKSPILVFESSAFAPVSGEDEATNLGIFGRALAQWLGTQLHLSGVAAGEVIGRPASSLTISGDGRSTVEMLR